MNKPSKFKIYSFIMAKKSQRRPIRYEKDQSGCIWGLISIFDFRQGRTTRRLLSDRKRGSKHAVGAGHSMNRFELLSDLDENHEGTLDGEESMTSIVTADAGKSSVKKLIEKEMLSEQDLKKENSNAEVEPKLCEFGHGGDMKTEHKRTKKTRKKSRDMENQDLSTLQKLDSGCSCNRNLEKRSIDNIDIDGIKEEFYRWVHEKSLNSMRHEQDDEVQMPPDQKHYDIGRLSEAIKEFISQKSDDAKHLKEEDGKSLHAKDFIDAHEILSSEEELVLKLIQDPNSLLAKYVLNLRDGQVEKDRQPKSLPESNFPEAEIGSLRKSEDLVNHKHQRNFFRRKAKSQQRNQSKQNENSEAPNRIVILKPKLPGLVNSEIEGGFGTTADPHFMVGDKGSSERVGRNFFLSEIKRKLKNAMGKEWHGSSTGAVSSRVPHKLQSLGDRDPGIDKENTGKISSKDHFYIERTVRPPVSVSKGDKTGKLKDSEVSMERETEGYPKQRVSNIYFEAKKHLSEMLSIGDDDLDFSSKQVPKSLGRILSLSEYNSSPIASPGRAWEDKFITPQMRFSAVENQKIISNKGSSKRDSNASHLGRATENIEGQSSSGTPDFDGKEQTLNSNPDTSADHFHDNGVERTSVSASDDISPDGVVEIIKVTETVAHEEMSVQNAARGPSSSSAMRDAQNADTSAICDDEGDCESLKQESLEENKVLSSPSLSPSGSLINNKVEDLGSAVDILERPSPVSVLEPLFTDNDISPTMSISRSVEVQLLPLQLEFEEHDDSAANKVQNAKTCMEDEEFIFGYVKAVLQSSGLAWDKLCVKCLSSDQLLDASLCEEVAFLPNQLCNDRKLLFDSINEVLLEVCQYHFSCCPWVSFVRTSKRPVPNMKILTQKVWEGINWHLLPLPLPRTLDQIVRKDMARSLTWMDLCFDADIVGVEMGEAILEDLMEDTILSCVNGSTENA